MYNNMILMTKEKHIIMSGGSMKHPIKCPQCEKQLTLRLNNMGLPELCNQCKRENKVTVLSLECKHCKKVSVWA